MICRLGISAILSVIILSAGCKKEEDGYAKAMKDTKSAYQLPNGGMYVVVCKDDKSQECRTKNQNAALQGNSNCTIKVDQRDVNTVCCNSTYVAQKNLENVCEGPKLTQSFSNLAEANDTPEDKSASIISGMLENCRGKAKFLKNISFILSDGAVAYFTGQKQEQERAICRGVIDRMDGFMEDQDINNMLNTGDRGKPWLIKLEPADAKVYFDPAHVVLSIPSNLSDAAKSAVKSAVMGNGDYKLYATYEFSDPVGYYTIAKDRENSGWKLMLDSEYYARKTPDQADNTVEIYRCGRLTGYTDYLVTTKQDCENGNYGNKESVGFIFKKQLDHTVAISRCYNNRSHAVSLKACRDLPGYTEEGTLGYVRLAD